MCQAHGMVSMILCVEMVRVTIYQNIQSCPQDMYMSVHFIVILIRCNILYEEKNSIIFDLLYSRLQSACQGGSRENINGILTTVHNTSLNISYVTSLPHVLHVNEH